MTRERSTPLCLSICLLLAGCGDEPARQLDTQLICTLDGKAYVVNHRLMAVAALNRNKWADGLCSQIPRKVEQ